jgi:hypothetical protein
MPEDLPGLRTYPIELVPQIKTGLSKNVTDGKKREG